MNRTQEQKNTFTVDRTNPFTAHASTTQLQSTYQNKLERNSDSRSTVSNFSMNPQYEVAAQSIMPVLMSIKEENELFMSEKQKIGKQMKVLEDLTQQVLTQNQVLRLHYIQRSNDLQSLVKTFTINTQQQLSQTKHLQHFYREHNCLIAKQIQQITTQFMQHEQTVNKLGNDLNMLTEGNVDGCDNLRNRQVKNKMISKNVQKLQTDKLLNRIQELEEQVCNLQVDNNLLKKKNYATLQYIKGEKMAINCERPEVTNNAIQAIKSTKLLKQELDTLQRNFDQLCVQRDEKANNNESLLLKYKNIFANSEAKNRKLKNLQQQKKGYQQECMKMKVSIQANKKEENKKQSEKAKLIKEIKNKKDQIEAISKAHQKNKNSLKEDNSNKISNIKEKIREKQMELNKTLIRELNPEKIESDNLIEFLKKEVNSLEDEAEQVKSKLSQLPNPLREIMRIQMEINQLKNKR